MDELPSYNLTRQPEDPNSSSQLDPKGKEVASSFSQRVEQTVGKVMDHLGATPLNGLLQHPPFDWIKGKMDEYRASQESKRILQEVLPVRLEDVGMKGVVQIPSSKGRYIVHVGQTHSSSDAAIDYLTPQIATSQKTIEYFLTKGNITEVFLEGLITDSDTTDDQLNRIRNVELTRNFASTLPSIVDTITKRSDYRSFSIYKYAFKRKIEDYLQMCVTQGWESEQLKAQRALEILTLEDSVVDIYKELGAVGILQAQGKVKVYPTEEKEALSKGSTLADKIRKIQDEMIEEFEKNPNSQKLQELKKALIKASEDFNAFDHSERETVAVQKIVNHSSFKEKNLAYLIYGVAHNFSKAVSEHNVQDPDNECGLIYVTDVDAFKSP